MSPVGAQQVVLAITLAGAVVWLISLTFLTKTARLLRPGQQEEFDEPSLQTLLAGSAEVEGDPKTLATKAAAILAKGTLGPLKIVAKTDNRIIFERLDPGIANQPAGRWFRRGELRFTTLQQNRTTVAWDVESADFRWLLWVGGGFQLLGLAALIVGSWLIFTQVASSPEPAIRWQSLQMLQVVHFLWPPFLLGGLYRKGIRGITAEFEALANNLPHLGD